MEDFGLEKNSWENVLKMFTLDRIVNFHWLNLSVLQFIQAAKFSTIKFQEITIVLSYSNLKKEMNVREPVWNSNIPTLLKSMKFSLSLEYQTLLPTL